MYLCIEKTREILMRKGRKEELFSGCFRLLLLRSIDGLSVPDIEKELGITRGSIFYYADTKIELFQQILEYYVVEKQCLDNKMKYEDDFTLKQFIEAYLNGVRATMKSLLDEIDNSISKAEACHGYINLLLQMKRHFPKLFDRFQRQREDEEKVWRKMISQAKERGELRADVDVQWTAKMFCLLFLGMAAQGAFGSGMNTTQLIQEMMGLYELIKQT